MYTHLIYILHPIRTRCPGMTPHSAADFNTCRPRHYSLCPHAHPGTPNSDHCNFPHDVVSKDERPGYLLLIGNAKTFLRLGPR